jgi:glutathione S-transferase
MPTVHGVTPSPFVRKTLAFLAEKGIDYDLAVVPPFPPANATPEYRRMSPLGKVPAYSEGDFAISDSSVICAYLERTHPKPALYPQDARDYARALWFEEFADSKLAEAIGAAFFQRVVTPRFLQGKPDEAAVQRALTEALPPLLDYLEEQLGDAEYLVGGRFTIADIAVATQFQNLKHAGEGIDARRWPRLAAYVDRIHARPSFKALIAQDQQLLGGGA